MAPSQAGYAPTLEKLLKSLKSQSLDTSIEALIFLLKRRQVKGDDCANATARMLLQLVARSQWHDVDELLLKVQRTGARLAQAAPQEPVIGNIVRRVLGLIRDEATEDRNADEFGSESVTDLQSLPVPTRPGANPARPSLVSVATTAQMSKSMFNLLSVVDTADSPMTGASTPVSQAQTTSAQALRSEVIDGIEEIMDEISQADDQIATFADIQIHPGDYVLVYLPSPAVERFLVKASAKRRFTVLITSLNSPKATGEAPYAALRKKLNAAGVQTINLATNGLMAYMPRVNKVIFCAKAVYQNGGLLVDSGCYIAARAAQEYSKPVIVLSGVYKFCPEDPADGVSSAELGNSSTFVSYADGPAVDAFEVENTVSEYLPPELVDIYLTNLGPQTRGHLAGIMADHYKPEEMGFSLQFNA
ncbi:hypothetical protein B0T22DRAFT_308754 [Podospora appendiculata]|uniref:Translation initiation factor eIF2B subunit beta n=1 Tax=Podospora appendiculata TaxID=314037 RepID=A0AAE1C7G8_9PEZI|nr:hypothetical protein B0T22DRAFT_308754 [Podospora appendiculata]